MNLLINYVIVCQEIYLRHFTSSHVIYVIRCRCHIDFMSILCQFYVDRYVILRHSTLILRHFMSTLYVKLYMN